jgi:RNA polymerase sigma-70 factor (ECF subfamily)
MSSMAPQAGGLDADKEFTELIARVRQGDEAAAAELVAQYEGIIRRRARRLLGPALRVYLDSVDIAQSVNRTLLIGLRRASFAVSTPEELTRLALTLVRRKVARYWRKRKREAECRQSCDGRSSGEGRTVEQAGSMQPTTDPLQLEELAGQVLERLAGVDRQLVELRLQGYTTAEAARTLGVSPAFLRSRLSRLRKRLWEEGLPPDAI